MIITSCAAYYSIALLVSYYTVISPFDPPLFLFLFVFVYVFITLFPKEMDIMANKILVEVKAFESRGGSQGAESGEFTYLAAVETVAQFKCPTCGNRVRVLSTTNT